MKVQCKKCHPPEGIEIPDFSTVEKEFYRELKKKSPLHAVKKLVDEMSFSLRDAKYLVAHINMEYGQCNRCNFNELDKEYVECPKCGALNFNWILQFEGTSKVPSNLQYSQKPTNHQTTQP